MSKSNRRSMKPNKKNCSQCNLVVNEEEDDFIVCDKCNKIYHVVCTQLDKRKYEFFLQHENAEFVCHQCDCSGSIKTELNEIKRDLKKLDSLQETMNFMSKQYDDILKGVVENKKKIEAVQKENKILKQEVKTLKNSIKFLNDQRVKHDCLVSGVEVPDGSSAVDTIIKLTSEVGVELNAESIDDAYFVKKRNNRTGKNEKKNEEKAEKQTVVVKFNSKKSKEKLMSVKPKLKETESNIFVNDFLSRETLSLLNYAKTLKTVGYRAAYAAGGKIFVKKSELSKPKFIASEEEVDELLLEATTNRSRNRRSLHGTNTEHEAAVDDDVYLSP